MNTWELSVGVRRKRIDLTHVKSKYMQKNMNQQLQLQSPKVFLGLQERCLIPVKEVGRNPNKEELVDKIMKSI